MAKQNQPFRKLYVGRKAPGFGCFFGLQLFLWARQKKEMMFPFYVQISFVFGPNSLSSCCQLMLLWFGPLVCKGSVALIYASAFFCCITEEAAFITSLFGAIKKTLVCQVSKDFKISQLASRSAQLEVVTSIFD